MSKDILPDDWAELSPKDKQKLLEFLQRKELELGLREPDQ